MKTSVVEVMGRLGNQLFQYALFLSLKKTKPRNRVTRSYRGHYVLDSIFNGVSQPVVGRTRLFLWRIARRLLNKFSAYSLDGQDRIYSIPVFGTFYLGYWQRLRYVDPVESELRRDLRFPAFEDDRNRQFSDYLLVTKNTVALHVRRGDYLEYQDIYQQLCNTSYYLDAIRYMQDTLGHPVFVVFSDDMAWCKEHLPLKENVVYVDWNRGKDSFRDMQLMSLCKHVIIANSTFSWWGAWLNANPDKIVITAKDWFVPFATETIIDIPNSWIRI